MENRTLVSVVGEIESTMSFLEDLKKEMPHPRTLRKLSIAITYLETAKLFINDLSAESAQSVEAEQPSESVEAGNEPVAETANSTESVENATDNQ